MTLPARWNLFLRWLDPANCLLTMCCQLLGAIWDLNSIHCGSTYTTANGKHHKSACYLSSFHLFPIFILSTSLPFSFVLSFSHFLLCLNFLWGYYHPGMPLVWNVNNQSCLETHCPRGHLYSFNFLSRKEAEVGVSCYGP